ncbi:MAG: hypothetical protein J6V72_04315 [Kiritimatiellae bacterium]|nr:hypothetical protein [Kiritimatiellia bacterium]
MEAFATPAQYRAKYDTDMSDEVLSEWLADASDIMAGEMDAAGVDYSNPDETFEQRLCRVCRDMVRRAIGDGSQATLGIPFGAKQASMTAGSYSEQFTIDNPFGDLYMKAAERRALGMGGGGFSVAVPSYGRAEVPDD